jgi:hypothetical protein
MESIEPRPVPPEPPALGNQKPMRPFGIYVIALLQVLNAAAHFAGVLSDFEDPVVTATGEVTGDVVTTVLLGLGLAVAAGLLMLQRWAWVATMLWVGFVMAAELIVYWRGDDANYVVMAISVAQVFYLNLSDVQAAFERLAPMRTTPA